MNDKIIAKELIKIAKIILSGDEWVDEKTYAFVKELADIIDGDKSASLINVNKNKIYFVLEILSARIPLVYTITEFGYGNESESISGRITSEENTVFRCPGGYSRKRDAREMWNMGKHNIKELFEMALKKA